MSVSYLKVIDTDCSQIDIEFESLQSIKESMREALSHRDWQTMMCLDRICERVINKLCMTDRVYMEKVMDQLSEIKTIYQIALHQINSLNKGTPLRAV